MERALCPTGLTGRGRRDAGSTVEMQFTGKTPQLNYNKAGVQCPHLAIKSYKFKLISFNLNNKCFRYNA